MSTQVWTAGVVAIGFTALFATACGDQGQGEPGQVEEEVGEAESAVANGQNRQIDIDVIGSPSLGCGADVCFFIGSEKNISHVWVKAEGCEPSEFDVEIDGHAAGPDSAGPPDCDGFGGVRYVTGGRTPLYGYFDTKTVCVHFANDVDPGRVSVQAKASATCEDRGVGSGECSDCRCDCDCDCNSHCD